MTKTLIQDIVTLTKEGWRPYNAKPDRSVYERIGCAHVLKGKAGKPYWFVREDVFCCVGCGSRCTLVRPAGFPLPLPMPVRYPEPERPYTLTPQEMVQKKYLLNVYEAAYCLNCADRTVYKYIDRGLLRRVKEAPIRVLAADVFRLMNNLE